MTDVWSEAFTFAEPRLRVDVAVAGKAYTRNVEHDGKPNSTRTFSRGSMRSPSMPAERMTGKERVLPEFSEQWPAIDRTMTPNARP